LHQPAHCTEARFASFLSSGYINVIVVNPPEKKLAKCSSVHCAIAMQAYQTQGRIKLPGILITKYHKVVSINPAGLVTLLVYKHTQIDTFCPDQCSSGKKVRTKVFNWSEVHLYQSSFLQNQYFKGPSILLVKNIPNLLIFS
jgi:hypothetical protein